jgi:hypothetical protein
MELQITRKIEATAASIGNVKSITSYISEGTSGTNIEFQLKTPVDRAVGSEVALRDGARALILPTVAEIGGKVRITAEVVDPQTQATVYSESADGSGAGSVLGSIDQINARLRERLGEALATVSKESQPLEKAATKNLDALRAFTLGRRAYSDGKFAESISLYRQALTIDSDFALARAFLRDAPLVVLDEPTADLDPASAELVGRAIERLRDGRMVLLIAHRAELASRADRIVVLARGRAALPSEREAA